MSFDSDTKMIWRCLTGSFQVKDGPQYESQIVLGFDKQASLAYRDQL